LKLKDYYLSYPIISYVTNEHGEIKWFPSEYFYRKANYIYCLAIDPLSSTNEMIFGGSLIRQTMFVFDITNKKVGYVRAQCSKDENMILSDEEIYAVNQANKDDSECYN
jgi:hypothetical protein